MNVRVETKNVTIVIRKSKEIQSSNNSLKKY